MNGLPILEAIREAHLQMSTAVFITKLVVLALCVILMVQQVSVSLSVLKLHKQIAELEEDMISSRKQIVDAVTEMTKIIDALVGAISQCNIRKN